MYLYLEKVVDSFWHVHTSDKLFLEAYWLGDISARCWVHYMWIYCLVPRPSFLHAPCDTFTMKTGTSLYMVVSKLGNCGC